MLAAFSDGHKADAEREAIRHLADTLGQEPGGDGLARLYQDVLLRRVSLADAVAGLTDAGQRQLACEMAMCVCDADGRQSPAETAFLVDLKTRLKLDAAQTLAGCPPSTDASRCKTGTPERPLCPIAPSMCFPYCTIRATL